MKKITYSLIIVLAFTISVLGQAISNSENLNEKVIITDTDAKAIALNYFGPKDNIMKSLSENAQCNLVIASEEITPFANDYFKDHPLWTVNICGVKIETLKSTIVRDFEITIDSETGKLLKIYSLSDKLGSSDTLPKPSVIEINEYFKRPGYPDYVGIPSDTPQISFIEALGACILNAGTAKEIEAFYAMGFSDNGNQNGYWVILLRGTELLMSPAGRIKKEDIPIGLRNSVLCEIDGKNGYLSYFTNGLFNKRQE
ncbi:MAG: hypothetical protein V3V99_04610 [candidate division Zixibacteria bacterium]